jgi:DNA modification methylase
MTKAKVVADESLSPAALPATTTVGIAPDLVGLAVELELLDPLDGNPRRGDVDAVARSYGEFGQRKPIVARHTHDGRGEVLAGNTQLAAAKQLGWPAIAVVWVDDDDLRAKAFALADNHTAELGSYDTVALAEMVGLVAADAELLGATSYTAADLAELNARARQGRTDVDDIPELDEAEPVARPGDRWRLGEHRLICGDARDPAVIAALLAGDEPQLMVTDPPYGVELDLAWRQAWDGAPRIGPTSIEGDEIADWSPAYELVPSIRVAYVWHAATHSATVIAGLQRVGFEVAYQIVWDKQFHAFGHAAAWYRWAHEPCVVVRRNGSLPWYGDHSQGTIWRAPSPRQPQAAEERVDHPNQKAMAVIEPPIENHLRGGELVFDPFLGSGTTLLAAEIHGRRCLGVEIDPKFVDLIVARWEAFTGAKATREAGVVEAAPAEV